MATRTTRIRITTTIERVTSNPADSLSWLPALLQTTDTLFPTGAYAHSGGLEALAALGVVKDAATLGAFLCERIVPMLAAFDLPYVGFAWSAAAAVDLETLIALDREYGAARLARESRAASAQIGRQRLRMIAQLPRVARCAALDAYAAAVSRDDAAGHAAIVSGLQAVALGAPIAAAFAAHFYGTVSGYASAALKLIRIGQEGCQRVLAEALAHAPATIAHALTVERDDAGWCDPGLEIAAARHERAFARLFIS